jgi:hypothetical protein
MMIRLMYLAYNTGDEHCRNDQLQFLAALMTHVNEQAANGRIIDLYVNAQDFQGRTAAMIAAGSKNSASAELLENGQGFVLDVFLSAAPFAVGGTEVWPRQNPNVIDKTIADNKGHTFLMLMQKCF